MNAADDLPQRLRSQAADQLWTQLWFTAVEAAAELERLRSWKEEAATVLAAWEVAWVAAGSPGHLGSSKAEQTTKRIRQLIEQREELRALISGCDTGQAAGVCHVKLRLIYDAMRAVCTYRRDCMAIDHKVGCPMGVR